MKGLNLVPSRAQLRLVEALDTSAATTIAKDVGVPAQTVRLIARGLPPRTDVAKRLADRLGCAFAEWEPLPIVDRHDPEVARALFGADDSTERRGPIT
jgi:hypothetical protein